uniref:Uncharacterized protein n=1 Tax=Oryza rufipogon TaxID=4529 RepID=A0A0E0P0S6_ORYRU
MPCCEVPSSGLCTQELLARFPLHFSLSSISDDEQPITMEIIYFFYKVLMCCTFPLHFSLSSIGDDEQPTTMEINYFYKRLEKISMVVQIGDDEQPKTMEIKRVKIVVHVASITSMILAFRLMFIIYVPMSYVKPLSYRLMFVGEFVPTFLWFYSELIWRVCSMLLFTKIISYHD